MVVFHCHFLCLTCFWRLSEEKKDFARAENMYQTVLRFTPNHANTLYNYAVLLDTHLRRKFDAEAFYRKTLDIEPKHAYALYNLAVLLEEKTFSGTPDQGNSYHSTNFCILYVNLLLQDQRKNRLRKSKSYCLSTNVRPKPTLKIQQH